MLLRCFPLHKLDLVAIRVFYKRDHRGAVFHRPRFARDFATALFDFGAGFVGVVHLDRDVAVTGSNSQFKTWGLKLGAL